MTRSTLTPSGWRRDVPNAPTPAEGETLPFTVGARRAVRPGRRPQPLPTLTEQLVGASNQFARNIVKVTGEALEEPDSSASPKTTKTK
jgi:hypothetical protein